MANKSFFGLLVLMFSPGAWVFLSNHTEALFLFLSYFALRFAYKDQLIMASILAGLSALTRNQGVLLVPAVSRLCG